MSHRNDITRRGFLAGLGGATLAGAAALSRPHDAYGADTPSNRSPNIVIILADDLGYGDLGCYGNETTNTPNLDLMAAQGIRFTDFHASCPVCSPTRAGLVTGRYQQRCGVTEVVFARGPARQTGMPLEETTFAEVLKKAGYATGVFGKWHLGYREKFNPVHQGFDRFVGYVSGNVDYISHVDGAGVHDWWHNNEKVHEEGYVTNLITDHSVKFIEDNRDRPFCLYVAHEAPHYPYQGPGDKAGRKEGATGFVQQGTRKDRDAAYKEMIEVMDEGIGRIFATLKRLDLAENTFVFFSSDNGGTGPGSNGPLRGRKGSLWEGGIRVPAMAWWSGRIEPNQVCDQPAISIDIFPTIMKLGGGELPESRKLDGVDLAPLLFDAGKLEPRDIFWAYRKQRAIRRGPWKLAVNVNGQDRSPALFNLDEDLAESTNVAEQHPDRVKEMREALEAWEKDVMD